jgi:hypothetical protein
MMEAVAEKRKSWNGPILKLAVWGQVILFLNEQWFIFINMLIVLVGLYVRKSSLFIIIVAQREPARFRTHAPSGRQAH